jgi:hypothetical protein
MEWVWIRSRLRAAEWHLDLAVNASVAEVVRAHLQRAQDAYAVAMSELEHAGLNGEEQRELEQRMRELRVRLYTIEHRSR